jgi:hypothetical protein
VHPLCASDFSLCPSPGRREESVSTGDDRGTSEQTKHLQSQGHCQYPLSRQMPSIQIPSENRAEQVVCRGRVWIWPVTVLVPEGLKEFNEVRGGRMMTRSPCILTRTAAVNHHMHRPSQIPDLH